MSVMIRIFNGDEDGYPIYDLRAPVVPREGETLTLRFPDREVRQFKATRVDHLIDVKIGTLDISDDLVAVRVYTREITPPASS